MNKYSARVSCTTQRSMVTSREGRLPFRSSAYLALTLAKIRSKEIDLALSSIDDGNDLALARAIPTGVGSPDAMQDMDSHCCPDIAGCALLIGPRQRAFSSLDRGYGRNA